ncbi:MAG: ADP-ribosylglycohydrolase family protein [Bacteroidia bacterium]|nr:MAG: ADP-ribosylglycohydrolase family protein [Bacteroidia bacterium]
MKTTLSKSILLGLAVGDALGVPFEFRGRGNLERHPVTGMAGYGTHNQPPGTWSDDSSLSFCLAESLCGGYDIQDIARLFLKWYNEAYWAARGEVFDVGIATREAILRIKSGEPPTSAGLNGEFDNGNGSLMRILPLLPFILKKGDHEIVKIVTEVSSVTHRHPRCILACLILLLVAERLCEYSILEAIRGMQVRLRDILRMHPKLLTQKQHFDRIIPGNSQPKNTDNFHIPLKDASPQSIRSSGYVVDTLEASLWCLLHSSSYKEAVLKAVNLGEDADTTACVTGGLAGILYGHQNIPQEWLNILARKADIEKLAEMLEAKYPNECVKKI